MNWQIDDHDSRSAYGYLRVSGKWQVDRDGFPRQLEAISSYANSRGIVLNRIFKEEGVTGTTDDMNDRVAMAEMIDAISANGVRLVLIETASRLARDLMIQELLLKQFKDLGISVVAVDADQDLTDDGDPTRKLMRQFLGMVSEWEKSMLVHKLRAARHRLKKQNGRCEGRKRFGERDGEYDTLLEMRRLRDSGMSSDKVTQELIRHGHQTRLGRPWTPGCVRRILKTLDQRIEVMEFKSEIDTSARIPQDRLATRCAASTAAAD